MKPNVIPLAPQCRYVPLLLFTIKQRRVCLQWRLVVESVFHFLLAAFIMHHKCRSGVYRNLLGRTGSTNLSHPNAPRRCILSKWFSQNHIEKLLWKETGNRVLPTLVSSGNAQPVLCYPDQYLPSPTSTSTTQLAALQYRWVRCALYIVSQQAIFYAHVHVWKHLAWESESGGWCPS